MILNQTQKKMPKKNQILRSIIYCLSILLFSFVLLELFLRIVIPKPFRITSNKIVLPANQVYKIKNNINPYLDSVIIHSINSLGLRGPELKDKSLFKIITVGGSTTNCFFLNDNQEWSNVLYKLFLKNGNNIWINNAGFSGQSTYGHILLLENYLVKLKPDCIIFYIGANDYLIDKANYNDNYFLLSTKGFKKIAYQSRLLMLLENYYTTKILKDNFIYTSTEYIDFNSLKEISKIDTTINNSYNKLIETDLIKYEQRIRKLINICIKNSIKPIFLTQATLFTCGYDESNLINLGKKTNDNNSVCFSSIVSNYYNHSLKKECLNSNISYIDMDSLMPKNIEYYTDFIHFTPKGSKAFAKLLYGNLNLEIKN